MGLNEAKLVKQVMKMCAHTRKERRTGMKTTGIG